jgi:hypothetical protein
MQSPDEEPLELESADAGAPEPAAKFFLAVFPGTLGEPRVYRAYPDQEGISFLWAGPTNAFVDPELARGKGIKAKAAGAFKTGLVSAAGFGVLVLAIIIAIGGRLAARGQTNVTDIIGMVLGVGAILAVSVILILTTSLRKITKRVTQLDAMSRDELWAELDEDKRNFRVTADDVSDVSIDPPGTAGGSKPAAARLTFQHEPTGKWKLNLVARKDVRAAARAFRQFLGRDAVAVNVSLKRD